MTYAGSNSPPVIGSISASTTTGVAPLSVTFSHSVSDPNTPLANLVVEWVFGDGATATAVTANTASTHVYTALGMYQAVLYVHDGSTLVASTPINIVVGTSPTVTIVSPLPSILFRGGDVIDVTATVTDLLLPDNIVVNVVHGVGGADLSWSVELKHNEHSHPYGGHPTGLSTSFIVPTTGHHIDR